MDSEQRPSILIISSVDPSVGPARVSVDYYNAFKQAGFDIDLLTLYPVEGRPEFLNVYKKPSKFRARLNRIKYKLTGLRNVKECYRLFYTYDTMPPVPVKKVVAAIRKEYDAVMIFFWQGMLSYATVKGIYEKLRCQIHFMGVDYSQMSGGCHFTCDCLRYQTGCGRCPAIHSENESDFTSSNIKYRKKVFDIVMPVVHGNLYMRNNFYSKAYLLKGARIEPSHDIFDMDEFHPMEKSILRQKYKIDANIKFIIFFGCQDLNDSRKGMDYLIKSMGLFWNSLSETQRKEVLLLIAGRKIDAIKDAIRFNYNYVGYVPSSQLPELYSLADVYLSPSIDDAGPTMVNQSLCCGTPVVAFEMGAALESVKGRGTGYCARLKNSEDFAKGISFIYNMQEDDYSKMRKHCCDIAYKYTSFESHVKDFLRIYDKYNNEQRMYNINE